MKLFNRILHDEQGVLTFEWILLLAILVIGIVGGLAAVRDALNVQLGSSAAAILSLNQSYGIKSPVSPIIIIDATQDVNGVYKAGTAAGSFYSYAESVWKGGDFNGDFTAPTAEITVDGGRTVTPITYP